MSDGIECSKKHERGREKEERRERIARETAGKSRNRGRETLREATVEGEQEENMRKETNEDGTLEINVGASTRNINGCKRGNQVCCQEKVSNRSYGITRTNTSLVLMKETVDFSRRDRKPCGDDTKP